MVTIGGLWPVLLNTAAGVRAMPPLRSDVATTLGLATGERFWKVVLPSLIPNILLGVKLSVSVAFVVALFIEILGVTKGLGSLLSDRQMRFDAAGTWGILLLIGICGYLLNVGIALIEGHLLKNWPRGR
jgi:ABC-type nitrate/sulfonate/bicarbonate transport system permease component